MHWPGTVTRHPVVTTQWDVAVQGRVQRAIKAPHTGPRGVASPWPEHAGCERLLDNCAWDINAEPAVDRDLTRVPEAP